MHSRRNKRYREHGTEKFRRHVETFSYNDVNQVKNVTYGDIPHKEEEIAVDAAASDHFVTQTYLQESTLKENNRNDYRWKDNNYR